MVTVSWPLSVLSGDQNYRSTTRDVLKLINQLKAEKIDGLVLDLRNDGGGYLPEATALTGLFIDHGPVVQLRDTSGRLEVLDDPQTGAAYDGPLAVLVDRLSASASEIFAGAIQDYHRGVILGQTTFGKGTVQNLVSLDRWSPGRRASAPARSACAAGQRPRARSCRAASATTHRS